MNKRDPELLIYLPAIALEATINRKRLSWVTAGSNLFVVLGLGGFGYYSQIETNSQFADLALAVSCFASATLLTSIMLRLFHNSFYFRSFSPRQQTLSSIRGVTYEVARTISGAEGDISKKFIQSPQGNILLVRLGLTTDEINLYLNGERNKLSLTDLDLPTDKFITFTELSEAIFATDKSLQSLCDQKGVTPEVFQNSVSWVTRTYYQYKQGQRWWSRDQLSQHDAIGRDWSYGYSYLLNNFSRPLANNSVFSNLITHTDYALEKVTELEEVLTRAHETNALLVGEAGVGKMDILQQVAERIHRKVANPAIHDQRLIVLDTGNFLASFDTKQELERTLITLLQQASTAGNVVLVIENLAQFIRAGASLAVDVPAILEPYLGAPELHLIFTADPNSFHHELERLPLRQRLEVVYVEPPNLVGTEKLLQDIARVHEIRYRSFLTYLALREIAVSADRYIVSGVMPDKAVDLLVEVLAAASEAGSNLVDETFVQKYVSKKTGVLIGPINDEERELLLDLEGRLHERVVGQNAAISAISGAMRRARAGVQAGDRPLGSFLFLGPTGVGKTETAKALATIFFGSEDTLRRIDMSEFSNPESFSRLLGTDSTSGIISDIIQEHPYSVILLDEFEKATQQVHDLFLQILDEGNFTDGRGTKVNMRNTIIIATSNAGSQFILEAVKNGNDMHQAKEEIIDTIISSGSYRPELINRFDGTILFQPLTTTEQKTIAGFLLNELSERIRQQGYNLNVDDAVIEKLVSLGYSPEFGARPMRRALQDHVEEAIAKKLIAGGVNKGDTINISSADITAD